MKQFLGALHLHSTYSDGEFTPAELRDILRAAGCDFACITDHAESFDEARLEAYRAECQALSDDRFRFIAGLEYACHKRLHILGYGVTSLLGTTVPQEVIQAIEERGGVSVIAHPRDAHFDWIESFDLLPSGIETWNSKYDGQYAPRPQTFAMLQRLRARKPAMRAFYGQDLHWKKQFRGLFTRLRCQAPNRDEILAALRNGDFAGIKGTLKLPASGEVPDRLLARFARLHQCSDSLRGVMRGMKKLLDRSGAVVPLPLKNQLRRLF